MVGIFEKRDFLIKVHSVVTFFSEGVGISAHTGFLSAFRKLSPLMVRKIIRLAAEKLSEVDRATLHDFQIFRDIQQITDNSPAYLVATFLPLTV